jgi:hypothetical protein
MAPEETPSDKGYSGVFDLLPEGGGLTESERLLARLCRKSFLSLWAFPNLHTDEGFKQGRGAAKEFTDVLLPIDKCENPPKVNAIVLRKSYSSTRYERLLVSLVKGADKLPRVTAKR